MARSSDAGRVGYSGERIGGYLASAIVFGAITAAWAYIVRADNFYQWTELLGFRLPVATAFYLVAMPLAGFWAGNWRYQATGSPGAVGWLAKVVARSLHFLYSHILIVLFTFAMMTEYFFGWNIDDSVREIDDGLFDIAARFAPWLSAYLAGFNLGRVWGVARNPYRREAEAALKASYGARPGAGEVAGSLFAKDAAETQPAKTSATDQPLAASPRIDAELEKRWPKQEEIVYAEGRRRNRFLQKLR